MTGKKIPKVTCYRITRNGTETFKKPMYELRTAEEEKAIQKRMGDSIGFWYGTRCNKCCGVYPKLFTETTFDSSCYYVCLVCGKESTHEDMTEMAVKAWNEGRYKWQPPYCKQFTIFDWFKLSKVQNVSAGDV